MLLLSYILTGTLFVCSTSLSFVVIEINHFLFLQVLSHFQYFEIIVNLPSFLIHLFFLLVFSLKPPSPMFHYCFLDSLHFYSFQSYLPHVQVLHFPSHVVCRSVFFVCTLCYVISPPHFAAYVCVSVYFVSGVTSDWTIHLSICWRKVLMSGIAPPIAGYGAIYEQLKTSMASA